MQPGHLQLWGRGGGGGGPLAQAEVLPHMRSSCSHGWKLPPRPLCYKGVQLLSLSSRCSL